METEFKWLTILLYIFTPEDSDPSFIDPGKAGNKKPFIFLGKIKIVIWIVFSIVSGILLAQLS